LKKQGKKKGDKSQKILLIGLGNTILTDDGIGIYVVREIQKQIDDPDVMVKEASLGGLELLDIMAGYDRVILVDAISNGNKPAGTLVKVGIGDLKGGSSLSRHQIPLHEAIELGRRLNMDLPDEIIIYGIQVQDTITFGEKCTSEVDTALPRIASEIIENSLPKRIQKGTNKN
jgi:hydrogenase maturation protease